MDTAMDPWPSSFEIETTDSKVEESVGRAIEFIESHD